MRYQIRAESRTVPVGDSEIVLGRSAYCTLVLEHTSISRLHAVIRLVGGDVELEDLGSSNGTFVNGERLSAPRMIQPGDRLEVGSLRIQLQPVALRPAVATGTQRLPAIASAMPPPPDELDTTTAAVRRQGSLK